MFMQTYNFKYYSQLGMMFVGLLLTANVIGAKPIAFGTYIVPAGQMIFPMTYLVGVILTEVYGFAASRKVIWMGLACNMFMALALKLAIFLPHPEAWLGQEAYARVLGSSSRIMMVSVFTYFIGEFINAYVVANLKHKLQGRLFILRGLCGNWLGEGIETCLFVPLAFYGTMPATEIMHMVIGYYIFKVCYAFCAMPFINILVNKLKGRESLPTGYSPVPT